MRFRLSVCVVCFLLSPLPVAAEEPECWAGNGRVNRVFGGFTIRISKSTDAAEEWSCSAVIVSPNGRVIFRDGDFSMKVNSATGMDIDGDGKGDIVLEGYSGGAHCCWTYWIISIVDPPGLQRKICKYRDIAFVRHKQRVVMETMDGGFDYFDSLSHVASPMPQVFLHLQGKQLTLINHQFWTSFQTEIAEARQELTSEKIALFRNTRDPRLVQKGSAFQGWNGNEWEETKSRILRVVLAYLYAGRENRAWAALSDMWPPGDQLRIRNEILKTARESFLANPKRQDYGCIE